MPPTLAWGSQMQAATQEPSRVAKLDIRIGAYDAVPHERRDWPANGGH